MRHPARGRLEQVSSVKLGETISASMYETLRADAYSTPLSILSHPDRTLMTKTLANLVLVQLWLARFNYPQTRTRIEERLANAKITSNLNRDRMYDALRAGRMVNAVARRIPFGPKCLARSLTVWWQLRETGIPAELKLGVKKNDDFEAHAWVEVSGFPITDEPVTIAAYAEFDRSAQ